MEVRHTREYSLGKKAWKSLAFLSNLEKWADLGDCMSAPQRLYGEERILGRKSELAH